MMDKAAGVDLVEDKKLYIYSAVSEEFLTSLNHFFCMKCDILIIAAGMLPALLRLMAGVVRLSGLISDGLRKFKVSLLNQTTVETCLLES
jgi:hypothetical protein